MPLSLPQLHLRAPARSRADAPPSRQRLPLQLTGAPPSPPTPTTSPTPLDGAPPPMASPPPGNSQRHDGPLTLLLQVRPASSGSTSSSPPASSSSTPTEGRLELSDAAAPSLDQSSRRCPSLHRWVTSGVSLGRLLLLHLLHIRSGQVI
jgi:hypothetical protein